MASTPIDLGCASHVPGTWSQCLGHRHSAWVMDTVSSLDRYLLGSYGLRYNRDRSRVNISSLLSSGFQGNSTRDQLAVQWPNISSHIKLTCSHIITDLWFSFQGWQSIGRHPQQHCSSRAKKKTHPHPGCEKITDSTQ
jgi:hypothetical protein